MALNLQALAAGVRDKPALSDPTTKPGFASWENV